MKILWITNIGIGDLAIGKPMGGLWMDALLVHLKKEAGISFVIVTSSTLDYVEHKSINGVEYYTVPGGLPVHYKRDRKKAYNEWKTIYETEVPDVIHVWGTEYSHAVPALEVANDFNIPSVIYIQGIMKAISRFSTGNIPFVTMLKYSTLRDIYRNQLLLFQNSWFRKRAKTENKLISLSGNVVVENKWAESICKSINPNLNVYKIPLNINDEFKQCDWSVSKMVPYTIVCNASGPAYKGLHNLLEALTIVRKRYPEVKLFIPGRSLSIRESWLSKQMVPGYWNYVSDLIRKYDLEKNVFFTGYLTQSELAERLSSANVFVMASSIENHSSSLKEAMAIGTPSIASIVGGVPEYFHFGDNGYTYRFEEYECLAGYICELFDSTDLCLKFSESSKKVSSLMSNIEIASMVKLMYSNLKDKVVLNES